MLKTKCNPGCITGFLIATTYLSLCGIASAKADTVVDFYNGSFSSVAIPPKLIRAASVQEISPSEQVLILKSDQPNLLPKQSKYCLLINHILDGDSQPQSDKAYYALKLIFIDEHDPKGTDTAVLYRNAGSWRLRRNRALPLKGQAPSEITLSNFVGSLDLKSLDLADQQLGYQWHGAPLESNYNSWEKKSFWKPNSGDNLYNSEQFYHRMKIKINPFGFLTNRNKAARSSLLAALLAYSPSSSPATVIGSREKVVFCFDRHNSIAAYLQVFTPIGSMQPGYILVFDQQNRLLDLY